MYEVVCSTCSYYDFYLNLCCHGNSGEPQRSTGSLSRSLIDDDEAFSSAASSFTPTGSTGNCESLSLSLSLYFSLMIGPILTVVKGGS